MFRRALYSFIAFALLWGAAQAQSPSVRQLLLGGGGVPNWVVNRSNPPDLMFDWVNNRAWVKSTGATVQATSLLTTTRAAPATSYASDSNGNWVGFTACTGTNSAVCTRVTNNGLLVEEVRTNSIRNNTMQGAVSGTPGTLPTNWAIIGIAGVSYSVGTPTTINGVSVLPISLSGTASATGNFSVLAEQATQIAATYGQTWTLSLFVANTLANVQRIELDGLTNVGGFVEGSNPIISPTAALQRFQVSRTFNGSTIAFTRMQYQIAITSGDVFSGQVFYLGLPQIENNNINSSVASAAIAAAGSGGTNGTAVYSVGGGTCATTPTLNITIAGGVLSAVNSVAAAGSCTVFPPSAAALTYVSGTGTGLTGATVNLTPTNNAASGFATSPITTTNAAVARSADVVTLTSPPAFGAAWTLYWAGSITGAAPGTFNRVIDASGTNVNTDTTGIYNQASLPRFLSSVTNGGSDSGVSGPALTLGYGAGQKAAGAFATNDVALAVNGSLGTNSVATLPASIASVGFGRSVRFQNSTSGFTTAVAIFLRRVPNAQLQSMTTP